MVKIWQSLLWEVKQTDKNDYVSMDNRSIHSNSRNVKMSELNAYEQKPIWNS